MQFSDIKQVRLMQYQKDYILCDNSLIWLKARQIGATLAIAFNIFLT